MLASTATTLSARHFDRGQESDADLFSLSLVVQEYGHGAGSLEVFERVLVSPEDEQGDDEQAEDGALSRASDRVASYMATHPIGPDRSKALLAYAAEKGWALTGDITIAAALRPDGGDFAR